MEQGKSNTGLIIAIVGGVAIIGVGLYLRNKNQQKTLSQQSNNLGGDSLESTLAEAETVKRPTYDVLESIENPALREYISSILDMSQAKKLEGWLSLIKKERNADSSKWKIANGNNTLNGSDVGHALYQMDSQGVFNWTNSVKGKIIELE